MHADVFAARVALAARVGDGRDDRRRRFVGVGNVADAGADAERLVVDVERVVPGEEVLDRVDVHLVLAHGRRPLGVVHAALPAPDVRGPNDVAKELDERVHAAAALPARVDVLELVVVALDQVVGVGHHRRDVVAAVRCEWRENSN